MALGKDSILRAQKMSTEKEAVIKEEKKVTDVKKKVLKGKRQSNNIQIKDEMPHYLL